jgi:diguanylate cyclase
MAAVTLGSRPDDARPGARAGRDGVLTAGVALSAVAGVLVSVLSMLDVETATTLGAIFPAVTALASGAVLARRGSRPPTRARYRQLLGAALIAWGAGQLWNGVAITVGTPVFPTPGDLISLAGAPIAVWGMLSVPRRTEGTHPASRLGLDSLLLGVTLALPCWHFLFSDIFRAGGVDPSDAAAVAVLVADITVVCLGVLAFVRDLDRSLLLAAAGAACYTVGDLITMHAALQTPGDWPWPAAALWCVAWPLIAVGLLGYQASAADAGPGPIRVDPDARGVMITTTASLALLLVSLGSLAFSPAPDRVALVLVAVAVAVFWARELLNARFRVELLRQLHEEATADPLTGLANRRVLAAAMSTLQRGDPWCLLTVDLDGFKDVNDLLGHATGDKLLAAVAGRLRSAAPDDALVSRIGGDEFAVLLPGDIEVGTRVGQLIVTAVRQSAADVEGVARVEVSASIGVAAVNADAAAEVQLTEVQLTDVQVTEVELTDARLIDLTEAPDPGEPEPATVVDPLGALSASGAALRVAKAAGRNRVEVYDAGVAQIRQRRLRVEERLRSAVETGAITVLFQPIVDLRRGVVAGAEALARWNDPQLGRVDPGEFITVAEQTGLVVAIGEQILAATLSGGVKEGLFDRGLRLSCNVSPVQLRVPGFHQVVQEAIASHGVPREQLVIEVTEQVLVEEGQAAQTLHRLNALGITIAIDDFGTGYSALGYLQRLPADILKIDRSLTSSLVAEPRSRAITRAVLDLGRTVGVSVVVEGVETSQVDDLVRRMGVGFGQGLHYGDAMTAGELAAMADRLSAARATSG